MHVKTVCISTHLYSCLLAFLAYYLFWILGSYHLHRHCNFDRYVFTCTIPTGTSSSNHLALNTSTITSCWGEKNSEKSALVTGKASISSWSSCSSKTAVAVSTALIYVIQNGCIHISSYWYMFTHMFIWFCLLGLSLIKVRATLCFGVTTRIRPEITCKVSQVCWGRRRRKQKKRLGIFFSSRTLPWSHGVPVKARFIYHLEKKSDI